MSYQSTILADTPEAFLRLNEPSGSSFADAAGHSHTGSKVGTPTLGAAGIPGDSGGAAVTFDGSGSQEIDIATLTSFPTTGDHSLEIWFTEAAAANNGGLAGYGNFGGADGDAIIVRTGATNTIVVDWLSGDLLIGTAGGNFDGDSIWHHLVVTYDGGTTTRTIYFDGASIGSDTPTATPNFTLTAFSIGTVSGNNFEGSLSDVAVYTAALSSGQVSAHYTAGTSAAPPNPPTSLTATPNTGTGAIDLAWTAPASGPTPDSYTVERSTTSGAETSYHTGVIGTSYSDTAVTVGAHYYYTVLSHTLVGGDSTASNEANAIAPLPGERTVAVQNTDIDITGAIQVGNTAITLLVPGNVTPVHTATGKAITQLTAAPTLNGSGFWTENLIPNGDITPAGTEYQFVEPGGRTTNLSFVYADGPTITLSAHYPAPSYLGLLRMTITGLEIDGLIDVTLPIRAEIGTDARWVGGSGIGQLVSSNNPIALSPDGFGNVGAYYVRQSELFPSDGAYVITNTRSGTPITFTVPDTYTDALLSYTDRGAWAVGTTYAIGDVVRDPATDVPYRSLIGGNIGHSPATSPTQWIAHEGARITANAALVGATGQQVATESMIATVAGIAAIHHASPANVQEHFEEQAYQMAILRMAGSHGGQTLSPLRQLL